jgi:tetraacyldisaccharide 4'-kinase
MKFLNIILYPLSILYQGLTSFRNHLYDIDYKKSFEFQTNLINVGNLTVGGTGKSPMVEYLIKVLGANHKIATLSRGYGRKTKGFRIANQQDTASSLGDEPFQFYRKFQSYAYVTVGEERAIAIPEILHQLPDTDVIILDDAFQHRTVKPGLNILVTSYQNPFYTDNLLPLGRLRESAKGANRADMIIVSKCPEGVSEQQMAIIESEINEFAKKGTSIYFTSIKYNQPKSVFNNGKFTPEVVLFSGIANSDLLEQHLKNEYILLDHIRFKDHHDFSEKDFIKIKTVFENTTGNSKVLLTTEKDMVRILNSPFKSLLSSLPLFYLPIEICFIKNEEAFVKNLNAFIKPFDQYS